MRKLHISHNGKFDLSVGLAFDELRARLIRRGLCCEEEFLGFKGTDEEGNKMRILNAEDLSLFVATTDPAVLIRLTLEVRESSDLRRTTSSVNASPAQTVHESASPDRVNRTDSRLSKEHASPQQTVGRSQTSRGASASPESVTEEMDMDMDMEPRNTDHGAADAKSSTSTAGSEQGPKRVESEPNCGKCRKGRGKCMRRGEPGHLTRHGGASGSSAVHRRLEGTTQAKRPRTADRGLVDASKKKTLSGRSIRAPQPFVAGSASAHTNSAGSGLKKGDRLKVHFKDEKYDDVFEATVIGVNFKSFRVRYEDGGEETIERGDYPERVREKIPPPSPPPPPSRGRSRPEERSKPGGPKAPISYRGVTNPAPGKFRATVYHNGKANNAGTFGTREQAARAWDKKARELGKPEEKMHFRIGEEEEEAENEEEEDDADEDDSDEDSSEEEEEGGRVSRLSYTDLKRLAGVKANKSRTELQRIIAEKRRLVEQSGEYESDESNEEEEDDDPCLKKGGSSGFSKYVGVFRKGSGKWEAKYRHKFLGTHERDVDAAEAYDSAVREAAVREGNETKRCRVNFPKRSHERQARKMIISKEKKEEEDVEDSNSSTDESDDNASSEDDSEKGTTANRSKYAGVRRTQGGKWAAKYRHTHLGTFEREVDAAEVYDKAVRKANGTKPFRVNFPKGAHEVQRKKRSVSHSEDTEEEEDVDDGKTDEEEAESDDDKNNDDRMNDKSTNCVGVRPTASGKYLARLCHGGTKIHCGIFDTKEEAAKAWDAEARKHGRPERKMHFPRADEVEDSDSSGTVTDESDDDEDGVGDRAKGTKRKAIEIALSTELPSVPKKIGRVPHTHPRVVAESAPLPPGTTITIYRRDDRRIDRYYSDEASEVPVNANGFSKIRSMTQLCGKLGADFSKWEFCANDQRSLASREVAGTWVTAAIRPDLVRPGNFVQAQARVEFTDTVTGLQVERHHGCFPARIKQVHLDSSVTVVFLPPNSGTQVRTSLRRVKLHLPEPPSVGGGASESSKRARTSQSEEYGDTADVDLSSSASSSAAISMSESERLAKQIIDSDDCFKDFRPVPPKDGRQYSFAVLTKEGPSNAVMLPSWFREIPVNKDSRVGPFMRRPIVEGKCGTPSLSTMVLDDDEDGDDGDGNGVDRDDLLDKFGFSKTGAQCYYVVAQANEKVNDIAKECGVDPEAVVRFNKGRQFGLDKLVATSKLKKGTQLAIPPPVTCRTDFVGVPRDVWTQHWSRAANEYVWQRCTHSRCRSLRKVPQGQIQKRGGARSRWICAAHGNASSTLNNNNSRKRTRDPSEREIFPGQERARKRWRLDESQAGKQSAARNTEGRGRDGFLPHLAVSDDTPICKRIGHGFGVVATRHLKRGEYIGEYFGELLSAERMRQRREFYTARAKTEGAQQRSGEYDLEVTGDVVIDATIYGGILRFVNSSCRPNIQGRKITEDLKAPQNMSENEARAWRVLKKANLPRVAFFAKQDIEAGEEITWRYDNNAKHASGDSGERGNKVACKCGAKECKKWL